MLEKRSEKAGKKCARGEEKRHYAPPTLEKRERLSKVSAGGVGSQIR